MIDAFLLTVLFLSIPSVIVYWIDELFNSGD